MIDMKSRVKKSNICIIGILKDENKCNRKYTQRWIRRKLLKL